MYAVNDDHLKDLYQEIVATLWKGYDTFKGESKISSWIYRIGINTCITNYRKEHNHRECIPLNINQELLDGNDEHTTNLKEMYALINQLDSIEKAIIMLWLDEKSYDEISEITGISRNNIASKLRRIKEKLIKMSNA